MKQSNVRSSLVKSDALMIIRGESTTVYTTPVMGGSMKQPDMDLPKMLSWARTYHPQMYKDYINADSSLFHNIGKKNHSDTKAITRMVAACNVMHLAYLEHKVASREVAA